ncbi:helicase, partial [Nodosilinea sp. LEGE 07298]
MTVIKLPSVLPGDLDLKAINQQLRERTAQLDWSAVISAPTAALSVLLDGLDPSDDAEALGFEGAIADTIIQDIIAYFNQRPALPKPQKSAQKKPQAQQPEVWEQSGAAPDSPEVPDPVEESGFYTTEDEADNSPEDKVSQDDDRVLKTATSFEIRQQLEERILKDLLGPAGGEYEEIDEGRVSDRYLVGLVAPLHRRKRQDAATTATDSAQDLTGRPGTVDEGPEQRDGLPIAGNDTAEDGSTEAGNAVAESMFPSSLGLTFCVSGEAKTIQVTAGWGQYERDRSQTLTTEAGNAKTVWKRIPIRSQSQPIPLQPGPLEDWQIHPDYGVFVRGQIRRQDNDWIVSLFLVNGQTEYETNPDQSWLFQPELKVKSGDASDPEIFIKRAPVRHADHKLDPLFYAEEQDMKMLYRKQVEFAVGHGVGVHATVADQTPMRAIALETRVVPAYEVPKT